MWVYAHANPAAPRSGEIYTSTWRPERKYWGTSLVPQSPNLHTALACPNPAWMLHMNTRQDTGAERDQETGLWFPADWKCAIRPHQQTQSRGLCPSGEALTTTQPLGTPSEGWDKLAAVWVLDCPLLGRNRRTHASQGLALWQLWRTISLHFRVKHGSGGAEGCMSSASAPTCSTSE